MAGKQDKAARARAPRVRITYDGEENGVPTRIVMPFVVGVLADLSGQRAEPLPALRDRKFTNADGEQFERLLERAAPRLVLKVQNKLTRENTKLAVELTFRKLEDFEPHRVAEQVEPLRALVEMRRQLADLLQRVEGNDHLERLLSDILDNARNQT